MLPERFYVNPPVVVLMACKGAGPAPLEYIGQWPRRGHVYACRIEYDAHTGEELVTVIGLVAPQPFKAWRWRLVAMAWMN